MLSLLWPLSESMYLIIFKNLVCQLVASRSYLSEPAHDFSLLGHLIMIYSNTLCIQIFILELEKIQGPPEPQLEISSKEAQKKHTFFEWRHTLFGRWGGWGVLRALTKKTYPMLFLHSWGPLGCMWKYNLSFFLFLLILFSSVWCS